MIDTFPAATFSIAVLRNDSIVASIAGMIQSMSLLPK